MAADNILQQVNDLNKKLEDAQNAQKDSEEAISKAASDISDTRESLKQVRNTYDLFIPPMWSF